MSQDEILDVEGGFDILSAIAGYAGGKAGRLIGTEIGGTIGGPVGAVIGGIIGVAAYECITHYDR